MATPKRRITCALEPETVLLLEQMMTRLKITRDEAIRLAIRVAVSDDPELERIAKLEAFKRFQTKMNLSPAAVRRWQREVRANRLATNPVPKTRRK